MTERNGEPKKMKSKKNKIRLKKGRIVGLLIGLGCLTIFLGAKETDKKNFTVEVQELNDYKMKEILKNEEAYPKELIDLALKKEETRDFVYKYIENKTNKKTINIENEYVKGEFPLFIQWDERWGYDTYGDTYIAINGCGPTTLAMVIVGLTGDTTINPKVVADFSYDNGYYVENVGTKWSLMTEGVKAFGIQGEEISLSENGILSTLQRGEPIIASMRPGTFTTSGHFIVLTGVTEDGKIIVNDPDSREKSSETWDIDVFMKETKNLWKFSI